MSVPLPPVEGVVLADGVDALPGRLRKRLDAAVAKVSGWDVRVDGSVWTIQVDDATAVTLRIVGGAVRSADDARCTCLLAPACLHRAAVLAAAPLAEPFSADPPGTDTAGAPVAGSAVAAAAGAPATASTAGPATAGAGAAPAAAGTAGAANASGAANTARAAGTAGAAGAAGAADAAEAAAGLGAAHRAATEAVRSAAGAILSAGVTGTGAVLRAALLRAAHEARTHGLHHLAAGARLVATHLQDARSAAPHYRLATLTDDLRDLLLLAHRLGDPHLPTSEVAALLGTARRDYLPRGSLRLHGLCTVPVLARSGHAGTATYTVDRDGTMWLVADIYPGDATRASATVDAAIPVGEGILDHRELARAGLMVTGATASESRQLGAGRSVRAVRAGGAAWTDSPLAALWDEPVDSQLDRAFAALRARVQDRPAGDDLLFLRVVVLGSSGSGGGGGVSALTLDERLVTLVADLDHPALAYRDNLRVLARATGVPLLLIGRPDPAHPGRIRALAIAPDDSAATPPADPGPAIDPAPAPAPAPALRLPAEWGGHADLGYDRLHRGMVVDGDPSPPSSAREATPHPHGAATDDHPSAPLDPALHLLRRHLERAVDGGRAVQAFARSDQHVLRRARWDAGADFLAALETAAKPGTRDVFGRLTDDDGRRFVDTWLAAAVYEQAAARALGRAAWSPSGLSPEPGP